MQRIHLTRARRTVLPRTGIRYSSSRTPSSDIEVDELCLPLTSPYTLSSLLPPASSSTPSPLSPETIAKLHKLSALLPPNPQDPSTSSHLAGLEELISIVQRVRDVDTSELGLKEGEMIDARIRAEPIPIDLMASRAGRAIEELEVDGETLLKGAERREGRFFVAQMPENVRTRKASSSASATGSAEEDPL
ncbi:uncharacterized protein JCM6883_003854 [Sporobolomyces salmoneus]|uniref:uncharacterized protein n=1 Tax=Sporobolomyces salmoneus TaxID=183962 RepID=UPI00317C690F